MAPAAEFATAGGVDAEIDAGETTGHFGAQVPGLGAPEAVCAVAVNQIEAVPLFLRHHAQLNGLGGGDGKEGNFGEQAADLPPKHDAGLLLAPGEE